MTGLHNCKPGNEPMVGQIKTFVVQQMPAANGKKAWTKIKSANAENGGTPYKILSAKPTGHTDSYGNVSFNIEIEPETGSGQQSSGGSTRGSSPASRPSNGDDRSSRIERQHSQEMALRYWSLLARGGALSPEDCKDTPKLRAVIDWFQRDVSHTPSAPVKQPEHGVQGDPSEYGDGSPDDEEIPF
jgi:hypothetical protein